MSKTNHDHNVDQMKQQILSQQKEIDQLHRENDRLSDALKSVHKGHQNSFVNMMLCVYAHCSKRVITDGQAGSLMLSLVNAWVQ